MIKDNTQQKTLKQNNKIIRWALIGLETLFLALTALYLFYATTQITTFALTWPNGFIDKLLPVMAVVAGLRLLTTRLLRWRTLIALGLALIYCLVYRSTKYQFLLYLAVLTVGLIDIDYRKILKVYLISTGVVYCAAVLAGMMGVITNYVYVSAGRGFRSAWGICYPTDFASKGFFLLLALWVVCKKLADWAMLFPCAGFVLLARYIAFSWNSTICGIVFFCTILWCILERRMIDRHPKLGWVRKGTNLFETCAFPLFALAMFTLMLIYARGMNIGYQLDNLLSRRLQLGVQAWQKHGLNAFGKRFSQQGNGFSTFPNPKYNFIDSTYPLVLLRYGWVLFLAIIGFWGWMARRAAQSGDRRLLLVLGMIAFHSFAEHHFIECEYNILLVMPLASFPQLTKQIARQSEKRAARISIIAHAITAVAFIAVLWLIAPVVLSGIRTVLEYRQLTGSKGNWKLFLIIVGILTFAGFFIWTFDRLMKAALSRDRQYSYKPSVVALLVCMCIGIGGWLYANQTIFAAAEANSELIEADRKALEIAVQAATGKVYSGILPSAYRNSVEGVCCSAFFEDDLARNIGNTFLIPNKTERVVFLNSGCLYVQISDKHALYTGDRAVVKALMDAGYHVTGYYSTTHKVSLSKAAKLNNLKYDKEIGLKLSGKKRSMDKGPYYNLYTGKYTVIYELSLPEDEPRDDSVVCTLSITAEKGKKTLLEKEVTADQFDENGILTVSIPLSVDNTREIAFSAKGKKGKRSIIRSIRYVRTPDSDTHRFYDSKYRVVREEYYDLKGNAMIQTAGYTSLEQDYDGYGNMVSRRFYDTQNRLILRTDGYAEVRWQYNAKRQIIRESFFDIQGNPVMISSKQAANEREYDNDGNVMVWRYYNTDNHLTVITTGYAELHRQFDDKHRVIRETYFGADGLSRVQSNGYSGVEQDYDEAGNLIAQRFFDDHGPVLRSDGYAQVRWEYNGLHQIIRESFYGEDDEPVMVFNHFSSNEREYDAAGNTIVWRYYDTDGKLVITSYNYAELHRTFNDRRWIMKEEYYGTDGQLMLLPGGYAICEREYDMYGHIKTQRHYGLNGEKKITADGYFEVQRECDSKGHIVNESFFDAEGNPIACVKGYASVQRVYDHDGLMVEESFSGTNGDAVVIGAGYSRITYEYTEDRQLSLSYYLAPDGTQVQAGSGYLHEYLCSLMDRDLTVFIAVKDEATNALTVTLIEDLKALGVQTDLRGRYRNSFYAIITPESVIEDVGAQTVLSTEGMIDGVQYSVTSAGYQVGNYCSIIIDGTDYSHNGRGLNIVVLDNATKKVIDSVRFDTYLQEITVTR